MLGVWAIVLGACAQEAPAPAPPPRRIELSLERAIELALANNLDIQIARFGPLLAQTDILAARAAFDFLATALAQHTDSKIPTASLFVAGNIPVFERQARDYRVGLAQQTPWGFRYELGANSVRTATNSPIAFLDPRWEQAFRIAATVPILRDHGSIPQTPVRVARHRHGAAVHDFASQVRGVVERVEVSYWELHGLQEELRVRRESIPVGEQLLSINQDRVRAGLDRPVEVTRAEADLAGRMEQILRTENAMRDAEDRLKQLVLPQSLRDAPEVELVLADQPPPEPERINAAALLARMLPEAMGRRQELFSLAEQVAAQEDTLRRAHNQLLPKFDLVGSGTLLGLDRTYDRSLDQAFGGRYREFAFGLSMEMNLGNDRARADRLRAQWELSRLAASRGKIEDDIRVQVRQSVRALSTAQQRIEAARESLRLARQQHELEEILRREGLSRTIEVSRALEQLDLARLTELKARIDYQIARTRLESAAGTLLARHGIEVPDLLR